MKKHLNILALAAVVLACAAPAFAEGRIIVSPRLKFVKLATTDSTEVAIGVWGGAVTIAAASDTTAWFSLGNYKFADPGFTAGPQLQFQINHQIGAATDSIGYILQYRSDPASTGFHAAAIAHIAANAGGSTVINGFDTDGPVGNQVRLILLNNKIASGVTRKYSVRAIVRGSE